MPTPPAIPIDWHQKCLFNRGRQEMLGAYPSGQASVMDALVKPAPGGGTASAASPLLRIRNLTKKFGQFTALNDVSLDVPKGESVCFLGPSGCGKTTLWRAIAGLDPQHAAMIETAGLDVPHRPP